MAGFHWTPAGQVGDNAELGQKQVRGQVLQVSPDEQITSGHGIEYSKSHQISILGAESCPE